MRHSVQHEFLLKNNTIMQQFGRSSNRKRISKDLKVYFLGIRGTKAIAFNVFSNESKFIRDISSVYLDGVIAETHALYEASDNYRFEIPSGYNTDQFLRAGNIQKSAHVLDDLFLFVYPNLHGKKSIIAETWSISSCCYHFAKRLNQLQRAKLLQNGSQDTTQPIVVRFLSRYFDGKKGASEELEDIVRELSSRSALPGLIMFSVLSTGATLKRLTNTANARLHQREKLDCFSLIDVGENDLDMSLTSRKIEIQRETPADKKLLRVNKSTYFPDYVEPRHESILPYLNTYKNFYERYAGLGVFSFHRDSSTSKYTHKRHNAFHVDVGKMFESAAFKKQLTGQIKLSENDTFVFFETQANLTFFNAVCCAVGKQLKSIRASSEADLIAKLKSNNARDTLHNIEYTLLDSAAVSGRTLGGFHRAVRNGLQDRHVNILIGIGRPDRISQFDTWITSSEHITQREDEAAFGLQFVERVVLPNWGIRLCPFCVEKERLETTHRTSNGLQRVNYLTIARREGLETGLFFHTGEDQQLNEMMEFGERSLFLAKEDVSGGIVSDADLLSCIATVAQLWRTSRDSLHYQLEVAEYNLVGDGDSSLDDQAPRVPSGSLVGETSFSDPIIRSALWRVFHSHELFPFKAEERTRVIDFLSQIVSGDDPHLSPVLAIEAALLLHRIGVNSSVNQTQADDTSCAILGLSSQSDQVA